MVIVNVFNTGAVYSCQFIDAIKEVLSFAETYLHNIEGLSDSAA
jgi:hypothetical protein